MTDHELLRTGLKEYLPEVSEKMIDNLLKLSALLLEKNKVMNLTAVTEPTEVVTRHFSTGAALAPHMPQGGRVLDVGTGAFFRVCPWQYCARDRISFCSTLRKRIDFLNEVIETLGLIQRHRRPCPARRIFAQDNRASFDMTVSACSGRSAHAQRAGGADGRASAACSSP